MSYQDRIAELAGPQVDPRHVEAWMRLKFSTLDGLSPAAFRQEVQDALQVMAAAEPGQSERLALSYGLAPRPSESDRTT